MKMAKDIGWKITEMTQVSRQFNKAIRKAAEDVKNQIIFLFPIVFKSCSLELPINSKCKQTVK